MPGRPECAPLLFIPAKVKASYILGRSGRDNHIGSGRGMMFYALAVSIAFINVGGEAIRRRFRLYLYGIR
jgi:hypothetical protein